MIYKMLRISNRIFVETNSDEVYDVHSVFCIRSGLMPQCKIVWDSDAFVDIARIRIRQHMKKRFNNKTIAWLTSCKSYDVWTGKNHDI